MKYEINNGTLAIVPTDNNSSLVYEDDTRYMISEKPYQIMEDSCRYFGSTYAGRKESAKAMLGAEYKVPIIVQDRDNLIVFPTTSPFSDDCIWINLKRIKSFKKIDSINTIIYFDNGKELIVPCSFRSIENQVNRASRLDLIMRTRIENYKRSSN